jgi:predicted Rossmann fold nucleotide-binding protein DprA/Smf involved in DNA uptake
MTISTEHGSAVARRPLVSSPRDIREIVREEHIMRNRILALLREEPRTIPELAEALGCPTSEVTYWVMGMRKYGYVNEEREVTDEGYYRYRAVERTQDGSSPQEREAAASGD